MLQALYRSASPGAAHGSAPSFRLSEYTELLTKDAAEVQALARDFLIRVTSFFRDPETFEGLAETVFPALFEIALTRSAKNLGPRLRIGGRGLFHRDCPAGVPR
jgi:chemotaxis methyl-accepting protein methylase